MKKKRTSPVINQISDFILWRHKKPKDYPKQVPLCQVCDGHHYWLNGEMIDQYDSFWHHISYELRGGFEKHRSDLAVDRLLILIRGEAVVLGEPERIETKRAVGAGSDLIAYAEWDIGGGLRLRADMYGDIRLTTETRNRDKVIFNTDEDAALSLQPIWKNKVRLLQEIWPRITVIPTASDKVWNVLGRVKGLKK